MWELLHLRAHWIVLYYNPSTVEQISIVLKRSVTEFPECCLDLPLQTLDSRWRRSLLIFQIKFHKRSSLLIRKLLANKIDAYVGFNPLKPAHRNAVIARLVLWRHAVCCTDGKEVWIKLSRKCVIPVVCVKLGKGM